MRLERGRAERRGGGRDEHNDFTTVLFQRNKNPYLSRISR